MGWPRRARTSELGKPVGEGVGQQGSLLLASHTACQEDGRFLPQPAGEEWREGGARAPVPPHAWAKQV